MIFSSKTAFPAILRLLFIAAASMIIDAVGIHFLPAGQVAAASSGPRLVGTVEGSPFSGAVFDDGTGVQTFYRLHEQLPDGSYLVKVLSDHIIIKNADGTRQEVYTSGAVSSAGGGAAAASPSSSVTRAQPRVLNPDSSMQSMRRRGLAGRPGKP